jgi:hypothetical protein
VRPSSFALDLSHCGFARKLSDFRRSEAPNRLFAPPDCRDEKLIKVGPLEVAKWDKSSAKPQLVGFEYGN